MQTTFLIIQIVLGIILSILIIMQSKGAGMGSAFGGNISFYSTRRGAEKLVFILSIIVAAAFILTALLGVVLR